MKILYLRANGYSERFSCGSRPPLFWMMPKKSELRSSSRETRVSKGFKELVQNWIVQLRDNPDVSFGTYLATFIYVFVSRIAETLLVRSLKMKRFRRSAAVIYSVVLNWGG